MSLPTPIVGRQFIDSALAGEMLPHKRTQVVLEAIRPGDETAEMAVHFNGDGPCVVLTPASARRLAATLVARADLIDAMWRAIEANRDEGGVPF